DPLAPAGQRTLAPEVLGRAQDLDDRGLHRIIGVGVAACEDPGPRADQADDLADELELGVALMGRDAAHQRELGGPLADARTRRRTRSRFPRITHEHGTRAPPRYA